MPILLSIQASDGAIASVPVDARGLRIEAEPGSIYKIVSPDGSLVSSDDITVTRTGRDLSINGLLQTEPVVILDFFLVCRYETTCRLEIATLGGERGEAITPLTNAQPRGADGNFLMWAANGDHLAGTSTPIPEPLPAPEPVSSSSTVFIGAAALGVLALAAAGGSSDPGPVASDSAPEPSPGPTPLPSPTPSPIETEPEPEPEAELAPAPEAPTVTIQSATDDAGQDDEISLFNGDATNDASPLITGTLTESLNDGQSVQILRDGEVLDQLVFDGIEFDFADSLDADGEFTYQTTVVNSDGDVLSNSEEFVLVLDTTSPDRPDISRVEGNNIISPEEAENGVEVAGTSEANTTIAVSWGDVLLTTQSDSDGDWLVSFTTLPVEDGLSTITAIATDSAGNAGLEQVRAVFVSGEDASGQRVDIQYQETGFAAPNVADWLSST